MAAGWASIACTQYYTATEFAPVRGIAEASRSGHATNVIEGTAVGMESTAAPSIALCAAVLGAYYLGETSGVGGGTASAGGARPGAAGLFGTAVATMGMLSNAAYVLAMDFFGPIADNAGGIAELGGEPEHVRAVTDELDAVGNTTKAATKGFAVSSALMACFLLFSAFQDEVAALSGAPAGVVDVVDIARPEIFLAGLLGSMLVFLFSAWTIRAVGSAAQLVVAEVKRQWQQNPDILLGRAKPDYRRCVALVTRAALRRMVWPGLLAVLFPVAVGVSFRALGSLRSDALLGARAVAALLLSATTTGVLMSLYLNNAGGAWDNAKKLIESDATGRYGGKGGEAHKASVTGDTVGDPFKDAAGPSIHVLIKLLSTVTLVACPLFVPSPA
jgi:inorganic pyrophosphatase